MSSIKSILHEALLKVKDDPDQRLGICTNVDNHIHPNDSLAVDQLLKRLFVKWPKFSGDVVYPVPSPSAGESPKRAFEMSRWVGPYGDLRRELLDFLIEQTKPKLLLLLRVTLGRPCLYKFHGR